MDSKEKPKRSFLDSKNRLVVACCECRRGGNGDASCTCGFNSKRWDNKICFCGELIEQYCLPGNRTGYPQNEAGTHS